MSKKATEFQKKEMSKMYRGKEIFKPLNTGWIDENVACVREWVANIFFYLAISSAPVIRWNASSVTSSGDARSARVILQQPTAMAFAAW